MDQEWTRETIRKLEALLQMMRRLAATGLLDAEDQHGLDHHIAWMEKTVAEWKRHLK